MEDYAKRDEYGKSVDDYFIMELQNIGLFVRDYSPEATGDLSKAMSLLHNQLCKLDYKNLETWMEIKVVDLVNIWAVRNGLSILRRKGNE